MPGRMQLGAWLQLPKEGLECRLSFLPAYANGGYSVTENWASGARIAADTKLAAGRERLRESPCDQY